ncbi:MAG: glycosyltransferase family 4 protein [Gemmatimonas sp.]
MPAPIRVHVIRTRWAHWGAHAGIVRYFDYLDRNAFSLHDTPTPFDDESVASPRRPVHDWARGLLRHNRMPWYTLGDLRVECDAAQRVLRDQVDVVHFLDPEHGMQFLPLWLHHLPARWRPRMVATFHQPPDLLPQILRRDVVAALDHVSVVSPDQVPFFESCLPAERITVILHGIDTNFFTPGPARAESATFNCITVGHNLRDFAAVRAVAEQLRTDANIRFHVVTSATTGVEDLPNVTMHRNVSDVELRRLYQEADVLFLPLKSATANNALLEAFACGLPAVTTALPATHAYASAQSALLVRDNDPPLLIAGLLRLRDDRTLRAQLGEAARQRAVELQWERIAPAYEALYRGPST